MIVYNLVIPDEYKDKKTGEIKTLWHRVGSAFPHESGKGFSLIIPEGVSISGKVLMLERGEKEPNSAAEAFEESK